MDSIGLHPASDPEIQMFTSITSSNFVGHIKHSLYFRLTSRYSSSRSYCFLKLINSICQHPSKKKQTHKASNAIRTADKVFNDDRQHLTTYYTIEQSFEQIPDLLEYYRYYTQDSLCFFHQEVWFLADHYERKKAYVYLKLKKQLDIEDSFEELVSQRSKDEQADIGDVLKSLNLTKSMRKQDQSYCMDETFKKLSEFYGPSNKTLQQIDSEFKHKDDNTKKRIKLGAINPKKIRKFETIKNDHNFTRSKNDTTHKRHISCELTCDHKKNQSVIRKAKFHKRRRSMEDSQRLPSPHKIQLSSMPLPVKPSKTTHIPKTPQIIKTKSMMSNIRKSLQQRQLKTTIDTLKLKIRKQKQNFIEIYSTPHQMSKKKKKQRK